jgi:hypothetical protein
LREAGASAGTAPVTTTAPENPVDAGLRIAAALEAAGISYALGGALAYGIWAVPRATVDVGVGQWSRSR